jgi:hypothetical protein
MAFEFQDFEAYDDSPDSSTIRSTSSDRGQSYRFNIYIFDNTLGFYEMLVSQFEDALAEIKEYLDFAEDFCSYNNIDNRFNDFFKQGVTDYFERQGFVPWELAPKLYAIHLDLVRDQFSGVASSMSRFAKEQVSLISPNNGTLDVLRNFVQEMEDFYETYYGVAGAITKTISSRRSPDETLEPSLRDNTEFIATLGYDDLPDIVDFTVDLPPTPTIILWNGTEQFADQQDIKTFINTRSATLAAARAESQTFEGFKVSNNGFETLKGLESRLNESSAVKIRKFINLIMKFLSRLPTSEDTYATRKSQINQEINTILNTDDNDRPQRYKDLSENDVDFVQENRAVFGNIGLMFIKSEKEELIPDMYQWFRQKTRNIRN